MSDITLEEMLQFIAAHDALAELIRTRVPVRFEFDGKPLTVQTIGVDSESITIKLKED